MFTREKLIAFACTAVLGLGAAQAAGAPDPASERSERTKAAAERASGVSPLQRPTKRLRHAVDVHRARVAYRQARAGARAAGVVAKLEADLLERRRVGPDKLRDAAVRLDQMAERREESAEPVADEGGLVSPESLGVSQETLDSIAACESGGDPTAVSSDGTYRGKYQFDLSTWASVGGSGDPAAAPEAEQDMRAAMLYAQAGTSPWPICGG